MFFELDLSQLEMQVLFCMVELMGLNEKSFVSINQKIIADKLDKRPSQINSHFRGLVDKGIIAKGPKKGINNTYKLIVALPCPNKNNPS